jgi:ketosteroid isomerase-like protein
VDAPQHARHEATDPLALAMTSPEVVARHDKSAWLALFTPDASVEDPVGSGAHIGARRLASFWDVFIAPNQVTFHPQREHVSGDTVVRHVRIATVTPVATEPFEISAIVEYRVRGARLASLRAFWEPRHAVLWHARKGLRGLAGLSRHGVRMVGGLGLGAAMGFGAALRPGVSRAAGRALAERLAASLGASRAEWMELSRGAALRVAAPGSSDVVLRDAERAWEQALSGARLPKIEEVIVAGGHVACVLASEDGARAAAVIARMGKGGRVAELDLTWSVDASA